MNATALEQTHPTTQTTPSEREPANTGGVWSYGPELLLVMIGLMAVGMVAGVMSAATATAILGTATAAVLLSTVRA